MQPGLDEQQAINRLKNGDLNGMEILVKNHQVRAVYTAYLIVRDMELARDIVQSAFLNAALKISQFDERRPFGAWFLRSVINASIKAAKKEQRLIHIDSSEEDHDSFTLEWLLDPKPGPENIVETEETRQMVWKALGVLSVEQRAAIIMRHFLNMSGKEITEELGRPQSTVRWWMRTAKSKLKEVLRPFWETDHPDLEREEKP